MSGPSPEAALVGDRLRSFIERIERLNEEGGQINRDKAEVFQEAKSSGFDTRVMKKLIRERAMDSQDREEQDQLLNLYRNAIASRRPSRGATEGAAGIPLSSAAPSNPSDDDDPLTVR